MGSSPMESSVRGRGPLWVSDTRAVARARGGSIVTTKVLLIGINQYQRVSPLRGCLNDIVNLRSTLKDLYGLANEQIRMIADDRATKAAVVERLRWLVADARPGDIRILHFAGHGAQLRDRGVQDELEDGLDEVLCPYDMNWDDGFISDDDLDEILRVPKGALLEVVLDCCHSGDDAGGASTGSSSAATPARPARFVAPPIDVESRHEGALLGPNRRLLPSDQITVWSASGASQTAADASFGGVFNGAFTFFLCKHLREGHSHLSRAELLVRVTASLAQAGFSQRPQLRSPVKDKHFLEMDGI